MFVSYRRADASAYAGRIYDRIAEHFGRGSVFIDVDSIDAGVDFQRRIEEVLSDSAAVVAVIGQEWEGRRPDGTRRIDDATDLVRVEIAMALARGIPVVPVVVDGRTMPTEADLPEDMRRLYRHNAVELSDTRWTYDSGRLITGLERLGVKPTRRRRTAVVLGVGAVVALIIAAILLTRGGGDADTEATDTTDTTDTTAASAAALFTDDFADNTTGWPSGEQHSCNYSVVDGAYQISNSLQGSDCSPIANVRAELDALEAVRVSVTARVLELPDVQDAGGAASVGLICRQSGVLDGGTRTSYDISVSTTGEYVIRRFDGPDSTSLKIGRDPALVLDPADERRIEIECAGQPSGSLVIRLRVDGRLVATVDDLDPLPPGRAGMLVVNWGTDDEYFDCTQDCDALRQRVPVTVAFDDFVIDDLESATSSRRS